MKLRLAQPGTLVDLSGIAELSGIKKEADALVIGAMTRHAEVAASDDGEERDTGAAPRSPRASAIARCATWARSAARSPTTIRRPTGPPRVLGLGATVHTNKRKIAADDFFKGMYETALAADEVITAVSFPVPKKAAYVKFPNPASRFALVGVFVAQTARRRPRRGHRRRRRRVFRVEAARGRAREELHRRCGQGGEDRPEGPQRRPARLAGVSRAPDRGARVARGDGRGLASGRVRYRGVIPAHAGIRCLAEGRRVPRRSRRRR